MKFKDFYLMTEMFVVGPKPKDQDYVIAFDKWIWILNDEMPDKDEVIKKVVKTLQDDLGLQDDEVEDLISDDVYDFITNIQEHYGDVLVGQINGKTLHLYDYGSFKLDPKSSVLVKKVVNQLKLSSASYVEDFDSTETKVTKKKMKGIISDVAYHGTTSEYLESIMSIGLRADDEKSNYKEQGITHDELVFFSSRIGEAMHHAIHTASKVGGIPIILEFDIPDKDLIIADYDVEKMTGTDRHYTGVGKDIEPKTYIDDPDKLSKSFGVYGYKGNIKPVFIKRVYVSTKGQDVYSITEFKKMKPKTALKNIEYGYFDY